MPWPKPGAFLREEKRVDHTQWLYLVREPCGDTSSGSETAHRRPAHCPPRNGQMKNMAQSYLWWPGLDTEIEDKDKSCNVCQFHRAAPLHSWEWPEKCWSRIHIDHAGPFMGQLFTYFFKKSSYVSGVSVCIFVALSVGMCVAGAIRLKVP